MITTIFQRMIPGSLFFSALSELLYAALDAIGVNTWIVARRTETFLRREVMMRLWSKLAGADCTLYHFGSQSEGTTTPGLHSDIDMLYTTSDVNIMYILSDWKQGRRNLLMVRDESTPAQHYLLQVYRSDVPEPETGLPLPRCMELDFFFFKFQDRLSCNITKSSLLNRIIFYLLLRLSRTMIKYPK